MTKITLSIAAAAIAASTLFTSAAQACISCEYVPEVVTAGQKKAARKELYAAKPAPTPKKRIAKIQPSPKKYEVAKAAAPKKIETAKAPETSKPVETAQAEPVVTETTPAATETREKPISTAALIDAGSAGQQEADESKATDEAPSCKKFFPAVGMTLTVPCE